MTAEPEQSRAAFLQFFNASELKMTTEIDQLFAAISKVQGQLAAVQVDRGGQVGNQKYNYLTLAGLLEKLNPLLEANRLSFTQLPVTGGLINLIGHTSGQWLMCRFDHQIQEPGTRGNVVQQMGSVITYVRRYCALSIWCVAAEDDDAASTTSQPPTKQPTKQVAPSQGSSPAPAAPPAQPSPILARLQTPPPAVNSDFLVGPADTSAFWFHTIERVDYHRQGKPHRFYKALAVTGEQFTSFSDSQAQIIADAIKGKIGCTVEWVRKQRQNGSVGFDLKTVMPLQGEAPIQSMTLVIKGKAQTVGDWQVLITDRGKFTAHTKANPIEVGEEIRCIIQPTSRGRLIKEIIQPQPQPETNDAGRQDQEPGLDTDQPQWDGEPPAEPAPGS